MNEHERRSILRDAGTLVLWAGRLVQDLCAVEGTDDRAARLARDDLRSIKSARDEVENQLNNILERPGGDTECLSSE